MDALALLAVLGHEGRFGYAVRRSCDGAEHTRREQDVLVDREDRYQVQRRTGPVADDERPLATDAVRGQTRGHRERGTGDAAEQQPQADELDRETNGEEVEVDEDEGRAMHGVHADDVDDEEPRA